MLPVSAAHQQGNYQKNSSFVPVIRSKARMPVMSPACSAGQAIRALAGAKEGSRFGHHSNS